MAKKNAALATMQAQRISIEAHMERDLCETAATRIRGIRRTVTITTTRPMPNRKLSCIFALRSSLINLRMGNGRTISAKSVTILKMAMVIRLARPLVHVSPTQTSVSSLSSQQDDGSVRCAFGARCHILFHLVSVLADLAAIRLWNSQGERATFRQCRYKHRHKGDDDQGAQGPYNGMASLESVHQARVETQQTELERP
jgi:hypothetical protein